MNFFEMLMVSKKIAFIDGRVTFYGQDISIFPPEGFVEYMIQVNNNTEDIKILYSTAKKAMLEYKQNLIDAYKQVNDKEWVCNTMNLYGHGKIKYEDSSNILTGTLILEDSFLAEELKNRTKGPVDHILRGMVAGIISSISDRDIDVIEIECQANGKDKCKLVANSEENLKKEFSVLYEEQIPNIKKS